MLVKMPGVLITRADGLLGGDRFRIENAPPLLARFVDQVQHIPPRADEMFDPAVGWFDLRRRKSVSFATGGRHGFGAQGRAAGGLQPLGPGAGILIRRTFLCASDAEHNIVFRLTRCSWLTAGVGPDEAVPALEPQAARWRCTVQKGKNRLRWPS